MPEHSMIFLPFARTEVFRPRKKKLHFGWPRTADIYCSLFHKNEMSPIIRANRTIFFSLMYLNSLQVSSRLKYVCSGTSVNINSLSANTQM